MILGSDWIVITACATLRKADKYKVVKVDFFLIGVRRRTTLKAAFVLGMGIFSLNVLRQATFHPVQL